MRSGFLSDLDLFKRSGHGPPVAGRRRAENLETARISPGTLWFTPPSILSEAIQSWAAVVSRFIPRLERGRGGDKEIRGKAGTNEKKKSLRREKNCPKAHSEGLFEFLTRQLRATALTAHGSPDVQPSRPRPQKRPHYRHVALFYGQNQRRPVPPLELSLLILMATSAFAFN